MIDKYSKKVGALTLTPVWKSLCVEISSAVIFHNNLVAKCRQMNKFSCDKKVNGG